MAQLLLPLKHLPSNAWGMTTPEETSYLRIVRGAPSPDELAALVTVLTALSTRPAPGKTCRNDQVRAHWDRSWRVHPSPGSWCRGTATHVPPGPVSARS
ncbi:acyl-CoA carboxylase subunit epsilon [Streptomyces canus]|uniref:acyl-CoA carboxylase subunit epsilon n=2 Tax=Streptomyces canus TaxID=58343 RepID=UPI00338EA5FD